MELLGPEEKILHAPSKKISNFNKEVTDLVDTLFAKLETLEGVGLAAVQVGYPVRIAVVEYCRKKDDDSKEIQDIPRTALINPRITWCSKDKDTKIEACFSLPKVELQILRFKKIHIEFNDETGEKKKMKAKGFLARAIQHEIDHLNGILITDHK